MEELTFGSCTILLFWGPSLQRGAMGDGADGTTDFAGRVQEVRWRLAVIRELSPIEEIAAVTINGRGLQELKSSWS